MDETVRIVLPLPPVCLSPNGQHGHWSQRATATKRYRALARKATQAECVESGPWEQATIKATFYHKTKRRRDGVNHNAMLKPAQDGIVDAGLIVDDDSAHCTTLPPDFRTVKGLTRVEMLITRIK